MTQGPRRFLLDRAYERVLDAMSLRKPQEDSLRKVHELIIGLRMDIRSLDQSELHHRLRDLQPSTDLSGGDPYLTFALATGVGKTRLMAALMAYLFLGGQSSCFIVLAPRRAILRKLMSQAEQGGGDYLFADPALLRSVKVWHAGNVGAFVPPDPNEGPDLNLFLFSPQSFVGADRTVARAPEFGGVSVLDYLRSREDLVALVDEAHHLGRVADEDTRAWTQAVRDLGPRLAFAMTATPRTERGTNVVHEYTLREALRDKLYTKDVRLIVREKTEADGMSEEDWDHLVLDFALDRLVKKEDALRRYTGPEAFPPIRPVVLVAAENTAHADRVAAWLKQQRGVADDEILVTHSRKAKTEDELERLVGIERAESRVRIVVNVFELSEGWDVTNVYVIAPLRAMGTYQGAVQTMGRGLRLPAGHRVDDQELDSLDVLCFGRQSLEDVVSSAIKQYGSEEEREAVIEVVDDEDETLDGEPATKEYHVGAANPVELEVPRIRRLPIEPDLSFDIRTLRSVAQSKAAELELGTMSVAGTAEGLKYDFDAVVRLVVARVISGLRYLSDPLHADRIEDLVARFLEVLGFSRDSPVEADWMFIAAIVAEEIDKRYRRIATRFEATSAHESIQFADFEWMVPAGFDAPQDSAAISKWAAEHHRIPICGWKRCTAEAVAFDSSHEFRTATLIDRSRDVSWWARNDPPRLVIPTPIGRYAPDFLVEFSDGRHLLLEIKRSDMWEAPDADARVKARTTAAWASAVTAAGASSQWSYWVVLDEDVERASTLEDLEDVNIADAA